MAKNSISINEIEILVHCCLVLGGVVDLWDLGVDKLSVISDELYLVLQSIPEYLPWLATSVI